MEHVQVESYATTWNTYRWSLTRPHGIGYGCAFYFSWDQRLQWSRVDSGGKGIRIIIFERWFVQQEIIVESDSSSVVSWMRKPSSRPWYFHELFILASRFSLTLGAVFSSHVLCEANHFADGLAKQASHGCDLKYPGTVSYGTFYVSYLFFLTRVSESAYIHHD